MFDGLGQRVEFGTTRVQMAQRKAQCVELPALRGYTLGQLAHLDFNLLGTHAVAPEKTPIGEVGGVAAGKLGKAGSVHVVLHRGLQLGLISGVIAGRGRARAAQHAQGEAGAQGVGTIGQGGGVDGLWIG